MAIFRRDDPEPSIADRSSGRGAPSPTGRAAGVTRIAAGTRIEGQVLGTTEVHVEGEVTGSVRVGGRVKVVAGGRIEGDVEARVVEIAGRVQGDIRGSERVELTASGVAEGDLSAPRVVIAEGAFFRGSVDMGGGGSSTETGGTVKPVAGGPR